MGDEYDSLGSGTRNGLIFFSLLIFVGGAGILGASIWTLVTIDAFKDILGYGDGAFVSVYLMVAVGSVMFLTAFFGCAGAVFESKKMLYIYCALLLVIFLVEAVGSVLAFVFYPIARDTAHRSIARYDNSTTVKESWDAIQGILGCCGVYNYQDWKQREEYTALPTSCCKDRDRSCSIDSRTLYLVGCDTSIKMFFNIIGGIGFGVLAVELMTMLFIASAVRKMSY